MLILLLIIKVFIQHIIFSRETNLSAYMHTHTHTHVYIHTHTHTQTHTHTHTHTHVYTHTHTHTHVMLIKRPEALEQVLYQLLNNPTTNSSNYR